MMGGEKYAEGKEQLIIEAYHTIYQTWWRHCYGILQKQPKSFSRQREWSNQSPDLNVVEHTFQLMRTHLKGFLTFLLEKLN